MKHIFILAIVCLFLSCAADKGKQYIVLSGKITNPNSKALTLANDVDEQIISLDENGSFNDTIKLATGYYYLSDGTESTRMYLTSGYNLNLTLDTKEFDESVHYSGEGSNENNYLAKKVLLEESFGQKRSMKYYMALNEINFLHVFDSLYQIKLENLKKTINLSDNFREVEKKSLFIKKLQDLMSYERWRGSHLKDKSYKVSDKFPKVSDLIDFNNERFIVASGIEYFYNKYFFPKFISLRNSKKTEAPKGDFYLSYLKYLNQELQNNVVKDNVFRYLFSTYIHHSQDKKAFYDYVKSSVTNKNYRIKFDQKFKKLSMLATGNPSPDFHLKDINNNEFTLASFKGKLIYIDIWATWCGPCIAEIPYLKKLEEKLTDKDIAFVSIAYQDNKGKWEKMVKEKALGGIQLFAPDHMIPFFKDYMVKGIPHFILIDKDGMIIDSQSKRPSNPKLIDELLNLL
jgi:thiol-disulfide isomerase/thioredoxin